METTVFLIFLFPIAVFPQEWQDILEPFNKSGLGIAFLANNQQYWSPDLWGNAYNIEAYVEHKTVWCRFDVHIIDNNTVSFFNTATGKYLSLVERSHCGRCYNLEAAKGRVHK